jgi:hypothetical protein
MSCGVMSGDPVLALFIIALVAWAARIIWRNNA